MALSEEQLDKQLEERSNKAIVLIKDCVSKIKELYTSHFHVGQPLEDEVEWLMRVFLEELEDNK